MSDDYNVIYPNSDAPEVEGTDGSDHIYLTASKGMSAVHGGAGEDILFLDASLRAYSLEFDGTSAYILRGPTGSVRIDGIEMLGLEGHQIPLQAAAATAGDSADNTLAWMGGRDRVDGGAGVDTLLTGYTLGLTNMTFGRSPDGVWSMTAGERTLAFTGIERLAFGDLMVDLATQGDALLQPTVHRGRAGPEALVGNDLGYRLSAGSWDDTLEGRGGDDTLAGGTDDDTAIYRGSRDEYMVEFDVEHKGGVVHDLHAGRDGTDTLVSIEWLLFADGLYKLQDTADVVHPPVTPGAQRWGFLGSPGDDTYSLYGSKASRAYEGGDGTDTVALGADSVARYTLERTGPSAYRMLAPGEVVTLQDIEMLEVCGRRIDIATVFEGVGDAGDDTLVWMGDIPRIDGGPGIDTLLMGRALGEDDMSFTAIVDGTWFIRLGNRELICTGIERLAFAQRTIDLATAAQALLQPTAHRASDGADALVGNDLGYELRGGAGSDALEGRGGNDVLYGGKGDDTAVYRGSRFDYEVTFDPRPGTATVRDLREGDYAFDGTDILVSIEWLRFADGTFKLDDIAARVVHPESPDESHSPGLLVMLGPDMTPTDMNVDPAAGAAAASPAAPDPLTLTWPIQEAVELVGVVADEAGASGLTCQA